MGDPFYDKINDRWEEDGVGTTAGVTVTKSAVTGKELVGAYVSGSGDAAALVTVESPASTILWRKRFTGAFTFSETLPTGCYRSAAGGALLAKISASTANCELNLAGYTI